MIKFVRKETTLKTLITISLTLLFAFRVSAQDVKFVSYHDEEKGIVKERYYLPNNQEPLLRYESFYPSGRKKVIGYYTEKHPTGKWQYFHENGSLSKVAEFTPENEEGYWVHYDTLQVKTSEGLIENGKKHGYWMYYHPNEVVRSEGNYFQGQRAGIWKERDSVGSLLREVEILPDEQGIKYTEYFDSGIKKVVGVNRDNIPNGLWSYYFPNGQIQSRGNFNLGKKEGIWEYFYEDGKLSAHGNYLNDFPDGEWIYYFPDGTVSSRGELKEGSKHGNWVSFYENGAKKGEGSYFVGTGEYKEYYPTGLLKIFGTVVEGKRNGKWTFLAEDGSTEGECIYKQGVGTYTGYYPKGQIRVKGELVDDKKVGRWELYSKKGELEGYYKPYETDVQITSGKTEKKKARSSGVAKKRKLADYVYSSRNAGPFKKRQNEFMALIPQLNPFSVFFGSLPVGVELYSQERLGHSFTAGYLRSPFFTKSDETRYSSGYYLALRQKFYFPIGRLKTNYIAHEIRYTNLQHFEMTTIDGNADATTLQKAENRFEYSVLFGTRLLKEPTGNGITLDAFIGVGVGYRTYTDRYEINNPPDDLFDDLPESAVPLSFRLGLNLGYSIRLK